MSLKAVHIVFIIASTLLAFSLGGWLLYDYSSSKAKQDLVLGVLAVLGGFGLLWYGKYFLKKLKNIGYL